MWDNIRGGMCLNKKIKKCNILDKEFFSNLHIKGWLINFPFVYDADHVVSHSPISLVLGSFVRTRCETLPSASDCNALTRSFSGMSDSLFISCNKDIVVYTGHYDIMSDCNTPTGSLFGMSD